MPGYAVGPKAKKAPSAFLTPMLVEKEELCKRVQRMAVGM
jgi:hypothetical protein